MTAMRRAPLARLAVFEVCVCVLAAANTLAAPAATSPPAKRATAPGISARSIAFDSMSVRAMVHTLADPAWEGRGIGSAGIDSAAHWIAARLRASGLKPGGDSATWYQPFEVTTGVVPEAPCVLVAGGQRFELGDALQPLGFSSNGSARARVVFAGYGITAPGYQDRKSVV